MKEKRLWNLTNHRCGKIKNFPTATLEKPKAFPQLPQSIIICNGIRKMLYYFDNSGSPYIGEA